MIQKYLDPKSSNFITTPDLIVIDHGHNDLVMDWYDDNETNAISVPLIRDDRNRFIGAVNYLIDIILKYNPHQKIAFIGHYESARKQRIYLAQTTLFEYWSRFPSLKLWEELNWTQDIDPETGKTVTQTMMPDDLHPYSDTRIDKESGFKVAIKTIGDCCYKFIRNICM